jgi:hypothetical protein
MFVESKNTTYDSVFTPIPANHLVAETASVTYRIKCPRPSCGVTVRGTEQNRKRITEGAVGFTVNSGILIVIIPSPWSGNAVITIVLTGIGILGGSPGTSSLKFGIHRLLFDEGQKQGAPIIRIDSVKPPRGIGGSLSAESLAPDNIPAAIGNSIVNIMKIMERESPLFKMVAALHTSCGFACCLNGGQKKGDQHSDNRNDNEKFDKSKSPWLSQALLPQALSP